MGHRMVHELLVPVAIMGRDIGVNVITILLRGVPLDEQNEHAKDGGVKLITIPRRNRITDSNGND